MSAVSFATSVDYVSTPAWVYDRYGNTISGLQPNQFRLFDNGKEPPNCLVGGRPVAGGCP